MSQKANFRLRAGMNALRCPLCEGKGKAENCNSLIVNMSLIGWARLQVARIATIQAICVGDNAPHSVLITIAPGAGMPGPSLLPDPLT